MMFRQMENFQTKENLVNSQTKGKIICEAIVTQFCHNVSVRKDGLSKLLGGWVFQNRKKQFDMFIWNSFLKKK